jgi:catechol 2,3-dioxygenase-like lactoylglutathione lyase family enzyme/GNAT superfamily N-acetyltransferase
MGSKQEFERSKTWGGNMNIKRVDSPQERSHICEKILRSLPDWFGIESAIVDYVKDVSRMDTWAIWDGDDPVGFLSVNKHNQWTAEVHVMGILKSHHRKGIGKQLLQKAEQSLQAQGFKFLQVKTLSESRPNVEYDQTRQFYLNVGFVPVEEFKTLWGEHNPCLLLLKAIEQPSGLHHVEIYVSNLERSTAFWSWLLCEHLGYANYQKWDSGISFRRGDCYVVFVQTEKRFLDKPYHRCSVGLNHLAFHGQSRDQVDQIVSALEAKSVPILYGDKHPHAGGSGSYAVFFEDPDRIKVEVVAP